jgi:hypothetical protein
MPFGNVVAAGAAQVPTAPAQAIIGNSVATGGSEKSAEALARK